LAKVSRTVTLCFVQWQCWLTPDLAGHRRCAALARLVQAAQYLENSADEGPLHHHTKHASMGDAVVILDFDKELHCEHDMSRQGDADGVGKTMTCLEQSC
jgi:hypothetical protein